MYDKKRFLKAEPNMEVEHIVHYCNLIRVFLLLKLNLLIINHLRLQGTLRIFRVYLVPTKGAKNTV